jgi:hypothetical protein
MGTMQGKMLKSQARRDKVKDITPSIASSLARSVLAGFDITTETLEEAPEKVTLEVKKCPVYDAAKMMGLEPEKLCSYSAVSFMDTMVKQLNPNFSYELERFRTGPDDCCQESIILKKELLIEK